MYDLFCVGGSAVDLVLKSARLPELDEKLVVSFVGRMPGGMITNAACAAARLGLQTGWSGPLGDDETGRMILEDCERFGVDASLAAISPGAASDFCVVLLTPNGERTILVVPTFPGPPPLTQGVLSALAQSRFGYSMPWPPAWFGPFADAIKAGGGRVVVDLETSSRARGADLQAVLRRTNIVFCSAGGLEMASGTPDVLDGARSLLELGVELVVVTLGGKGAQAVSAGEIVVSPAFHVPVVDTTGAGDCFHAACLYGMLAGWPLEQSLQFASAAAACKVQHLGPRAGLPTRREVEMFLKENASG